MVNAKDGYLFLAVGVEVCRVMGRIEFHIHADDDTEETAQLRHENILRYQLGKASGVVP
jgi:hypothetical protein